MTFAEQCFEQGRKEGRQEARKEGMALALLMIIDAKFGSLPISTEEQIRRLKIDEITPLFQKVLLCNGIDEILSPNDGFRKVGL